MSGSEPDRSGDIRCVVTRSLLPEDLALPHHHELHQPARWPWHAPLLHDAQPVSYTPMLGDSAFVEPADIDHVHSHMFPRPGDRPQLALVSAFADQTKAHLIPLDDGAGDAQLEVGDCPSQPLDPSFQPLEVGCREPPLMLPEIRCEEIVESGQVAAVEAFFDDLCEDLDVADLLRSAIGLAHQPNSTVNEAQHWVE